MPAPGLIALPTTLPGVILLELAAGDDASRRLVETYLADRPGDDRRYAIGPARLEAELGWRPAIPFARGLRDTIAWYLARPAWPA